MSACFNISERVRINFLCNTFLPMLHDEVDQLFFVIKGVQSLIFNHCHLRTNKNKLKLFTSLRSLCSIARSTLLSICYCICIVFSSHDMVSHTWQILHSSSSYKHNTMLLEWVSLSWNICQYFCTIRKPYLCELSLSWIWFLWSHYWYLKTYPSLEWSRLCNLFVSLKLVYSKLKDRCLWLKGFLYSSFFNKLINRWHLIFPEI